jgi:hypothetical protein
MVRLLLRVRHQAHAGAQRLVLTPILFQTTDVDRVRSDAIRNIVPEPPTLPEVVRAYRTPATLAWFQAS